MTLASGARFFSQICRILVVGRKAQKVVCFWSPGGLQALSPHVICPVRGRGEGRGCSNWQVLPSTCPSGSCVGVVGMEGTHPSNWQGCCKLFLGGGNNHHLEASPSQIHSPLTAQDSPVMDKAIWMFFMLLHEPREQTARSQKKD